MKKVLILTYYYKHKNAMASVRAIKLAKYLSRQDCQVTVLTSSQKDTWTKQYQEPVPDEAITEWYAPAVGRWLRIGRFLNWRGARGAAREAAASAAAAVPPATAAAPAAAGLKTRLIRFAKWRFYFELAKQEDICMFKGLKAEYRRRGCPEFDTVIATYPTYGAFRMGMWLKRHHHCRTLIADFRDPLYNPGFRTRKREVHFDLRCLKNITAAADRLVCVSQGIADGIREQFPSLVKEPIRIITNGYDTEDVADDTPPADLAPGKRHFVYTGTLYHGKRCVDMLAQVLRFLIDEGIVPPDAFTFDYAGPDFSELLDQLGVYGLADNAVDHGFVSRKESIALQKGADALLLLTWNEATYQGVIPGKLFEYMAIGTAPIIALVTGDVPGSEVAAIVRDTHSGCACEQAVPADIGQLKAFVLALFKGTGKTKGQTEQYDYCTISRLYRELV